MRSSREIAHRALQEATNVRLMWWPPRAKSTFAKSILPEPKACAAALRRTAYAAEVLRLAEQIRQHRFPLLGFTIDPGPDIHWRRDEVNGVETGTQYFRSIPYLNVTRAGDHKNIWELNRHQHLVLLAQAYLLDSNQANIDEIAAEIESWIRQNPFQRGMNWASALEVAFRALSWLWVLHLVGESLTPGLRSRLIEQLNLHGRHLENNLSLYFSPNTHLLGEAVALHAIGVLVPELPRARRWREKGAQVVGEQMEKQVRADGSHFEQSTYYHVYALDMFLFHALLGSVSDAFRAKLEHMAEYLDAILGPSRQLPFVGDDDGGRFFHPFGERDRFARATLAACSLFFKRPEWLESAEDLHEIAGWWYGVHTSPGKHCLNPPSRIFRDAGTAVMTSGDRHVLVDAGPFGPWGSGHSHSDTLSLVVRRGSDEILIDPGTYTYVGDEHWRNWFRGSAAHSTVRIDSYDQATRINPFRWADQPSVRVRSWESSASEDYLDAECSYRGFTHRRQVRFTKPDAILVSDEVSGPPGAHNVEQLWHLGSEDAEQRLQLEAPVQKLEGWRSRTFGDKTPSVILRVHRRCELPCRFEARIDLK
ncbi:MAG TPA: alginate lyase family protein [Bryobacteraceae bacterium]|nr:alginate lyase family protein [Bryobacteraceae bacterium]